MSSINKKDLKLKIGSEIKLIIEKFNQLKEQSKPISPENSLGRISRMDAINTESIIEVLFKQTEQKLTKLNVALSKIADPDLEICIQCIKYS